SVNQPPRPDATVGTPLLQKEGKLLLTSSDLCINITTLNLTAMPRFGGGKLILFFPSTILRRDSNGKEG
ncbi:MAG TPA: hypothetical protein DD745_10730, partial [Bacteroidales bacterium]|nr:hypothetical protein [Bacteroidales bacterium]